MPEVKWVYPEWLDGPHNTRRKTPVLTLDDLEAWLRQEYEASQLNGERGYVSAKDLLAHVQAMRGKP